MKKTKALAIRLLSLYMVLITLLSVTPPVLAAGNVSSSVASNEQVTPRIDETGWFFRTYNGLFQKRLWSYTEGKWLTDWITVGTAA